MKKAIAIALSIIIIVFLFCSCQNQSKGEAAVLDIVKYCNEERTTAGLGGLTLDSSLSEAAQVRAGEITTDENFAHVRPDGSGCFTVLRTDYIYAGENLAKGEPDGKKIVKAWMDSEPHRKNVLTPEYNKIGLAYTEVDGVYYWAAIFTD